MQCLAITVLRVLLVILAVISGPACCAESQEPISISNDHLQITIDRKCGVLEELTDLKAKHNHVSGAPGAGGLWEMELFQGDQIVMVSPEQAKSFHCELPPGSHLKTLRLTWDHFDIPAAPRLNVQVTVRLEADRAMSRWGIALDGLGELVPRKVRFPRMLDLPPQANEVLAVPVWLGQQTANARQILSGPAGKGRRLEWAYPGLLSLQCFAFYQQSGPGLYVACDDTAAFGKVFAFFGDGQGSVGCELVHFPENARPAADHWKLPYDVLLGTFQGDWFTAAERYRAWATNQVWARESRLRQGTVPDWVLNTGLWIWNRGRSGNVLPPALALQERLGLSVNVFWHWWHGCSYDTGFPEYLPPREGAEPFKTALATAHDRGLHALVYMNQRLWGMTTESWRAEGAERFAVKGTDGKVHPEVYNTFTKVPCASMCMGTEFWRNKYAGLADCAVRELGVDGIYMDQACTSLACYDTTHGHPVGGGRYWMNGFHSLAAEIRQRCGGSGGPGPGLSAAPSRAQPQVALAGEGCGEPWLPYLDLMLSLQVSKERYAAQDGWETLPFFQAVYHAYAVTYGNYSSLTMPPYDDLWPAQFAPQEPLKLLDKRFSRQFCLEQARAFVWGQQPTIANFLPSQFEQRPEEVDYVLRLARLRTRARKYLLHGTFLRPPELRAPEATLDMSRLSIYAGQQGGLTAFQKSFPLALAGAWRAPDGHVAIALASIANKALTVSLVVDPKAYGLPRNVRPYCTTDTGRFQLPAVTLEGSPLSLTLAPRQACLLEFAP
jgi:hypothetical protein